MLWSLSQYLQLYKNDKFFCVQFVGTSFTEDLKQVGWNTINIDKDFGNQATMRCTYMNSV